MLLVLGLAPLSILGGDRPDRPAGLSVEVTAGAGAPAARSSRHDVPVGLPADAEIRTVEDVRPYADRALGPDRAQALLAVLKSGELLSSQLAEKSGGYPDYPYRYPALEPLLGDPPEREGASAWTALGAALAVLAAQATLYDEQVDAEDNAGPAAFAVLHRARTHGSCAAQLNLLLLVVGEASIVANATPGDSSALATALATEQRRAEEACPGDVTSGWLVGQAQLRLVSEGPYPEDPEMPTADAVATMQRLVDRHPTDVAALTGLGDAYLAAAMSLDGGPPFTARRYFRQAVAAYNRAVDHGGHRDAAAGLGRALIGLGEPERAIELFTPLAGSDPTPGPVLEALIAAQEKAGRFADAERTARRLADLGAAAYPRGPALIPDPQRSWENTLEDVTPALSLGTNRLQPLRSQLWPEGGAGGSAQDLSFIPQYRDVAGLTGTHAACASWAWRRNAVLAGHAATALADWSTSNTSARPDGFGCDPSDVDPTRLRAVADLLTAGDEVLQDVDGDAAADDWQNLLRWAGDLPAARRFVVRWAEARGDGSELPAFRLGEIEFLQHRYDEAAAQFAVAARQTRLLRYDDDLAVAWAQLDRAASLVAGGRSSEAEATLRRLIDVGVAGYAYQASEEGVGATAGFALVSYHASALLADGERQTERLRAAVEDYETALSWLERWLSVPAPEVLYNNAALAHLGLGNTARASQLVEQALQLDPQSPVTLMTAGFIADRRGDIPEALRLNELALDNDPGLYPAANDLGVQVARLDRPTEARSAFRQAVGARPDYALGWFNLGVLEASSGPARLLASQHALATAYRLDPDLRDRRLELTIDAQVYRTALDLSKPLPAAWTFADLQRPAPAAAVGLLALAGLGLGLARAANRGASENADQWLEPVTRRLEALPVVSRADAPVWAISATLLTFLLADLHHGSAATATALYPLGLLVLVITAMCARVMAGTPAGEAPRQRSWGPGIVVGIAAGAVGYPWAALPVVDATKGAVDRDNSAEDTRGGQAARDEDAVGTAAEADTARSETRLHLAAPLTLAGVALVLFLESAWMHTPVVESWAVAALVMCASLLLPVGPLDGAHLGTAGIAVSAGVVGTALLLFLGLL
ncbi:tetratricopeptide repeat protein [Geodermatophilus sp. SYSU D00710]